jgi:DegV family protein with EDD domain
MSVRIVTDSNCDLPPEIIQEHGIVVVPLYINIGTESYLDGVDMSREEFYTGLPSFHRHPTTSVPGPGMFVEAYNRLAAEGASHILSIHISATLSAVVNSARLAAEEIQAPPVTILDSGNLTLGTGLLAVRAAEAAREGKGVDEILEILEDQIKRTYCFAGLDTLEYLRRSGRLTRLQSGLGSMLQIKPLLSMHDGEMGMERVRTRKKAVGRVVELVNELGPLEQLAIVHTHAPKRAESLRRQAEHLFPSSPPRLSAEVTPVIGTHIGPGAVGFVAVTSPGP